MQLSDAIRLGAMLKPQGFEALLDDGRTCALGAAIEAVGGVIREGQTYPGRAIYRRWPLLKTLILNPCPGYNRRRVQVAAVISAMNDTEHWTRQQIADWVETLESPAPAPTLASPLDEMFAVVPVDGIVAPAAARGSK